MTRDHKKEAIEKIRAEMEQRPRQTRRDILFRSGTGVTDFQAAMKVLHLEYEVSTNPLHRGYAVWSLPKITKSTVERINVMHVQAYVPSNFQPPRANSLAYKAIQSKGIGA